MQLLPKWVLPPTLPAIYDLESATAQEMTAKVYGAMQTLIGEYNAFADSVNTALGTFTESETKARTDFETAVTKVYREYTCQMDQYLRLNLEETASEIIVNGINTGEIYVGIEYRKDDESLNILVSASMPGHGKRIVYNAEEQAIAHL